MTVQHSPQGHQVSHDQVDHDGMSNSDMQSQSPPPFQLTAQDAPSPPPPNPGMMEATLQRSQGRNATLTTASAETKQVAPGPVIQRIATQITTDDDGTDTHKQVITEVAVRGRPPRTFADSMGDHTTAFVVQVEGLNVQLRGLTVPQALARMVQLRDHLRTLPGYAVLQANVRSGVGGAEIAERYTAAENALNQHLTDAGTTGNAQVQMHHFQEAIDHYLDARELIPFSTINVGAKSKGLAGSGHGESGPAGMVSTVEQEIIENKGSTDGITYDLEQLTEAVYRLFDFQSAGMAAAEISPEMLGRLTNNVHFGTLEESAEAPSFNLMDNPEDRIRLIWRQHLASMQQMFPRVFEFVKGNLDESRLMKVMEHSLDQDFVALSNDANNHLNYLERAHLEYSASHKDKRLSKGRGILTRSESFATMYRDQHELLRIIREMLALNSIAKDRYTEAIRDIERKVHTFNLDDIRKPHYDETKDGPAMSKEIQNQIGHAESKREKNDGSAAPNHVKNLGNLGAAKTGRPMENWKRSITGPRKRNRDDDDELDVAEIEMGGVGETLSSEMNPMSIQVTLGPDGRITGMASAGRPHSPFKGTMGAHSTAWTAHLDRVRAAIRNRSISEAYTQLLRLRERVITFAETRSDRDLGENAHLLIEGSRTRMDALAGVNANQADLSTLQRFIDAILSYYNLLPGVSRDKIDTGGKGEGTYRKRLLNYESTGEGTRDEITEAIRGLFDGRSGRGGLWENHLTVMQEAYPHSAAFSIRGTAHPSPGSAPVAVDTHEEDEEEAIGPLDASQVEELKKMAHADGSWVVHQNNCLLNAVAQAAGIARPLHPDLIIAIRRDIGAPLGTMLFASERVLNIIARHMGLPNGIVVVYHRSRYTDETSDVQGGGGNPVYVYHDGINHFTSLG